MLTSMPRPASVSPSVAAPVDTDAARPVEKESTPTDTLTLQSTAA